MAAKTKAPKTVFMRCAVCPLERPVHFLRGVEYHQRGTDRRSVGVRFAGR